MSSDSKTIVKSRLAISERLDNIEKRLETTLRIDKMEKRLENSCTDSQQSSSCNEQAAGAKKEEALSRKPRKLGKSFTQSELVIS